MSVLRLRYALIALLLLGASSPSQASLVLSVDNVTVDVDGRGTVEVFVDRASTATTPTLDNFTVTLDLVKTAGSGTGQVLVVDNDTPATFRNNDNRHVFAGSVNPLFNDRPINSGQGFEVIDNAGFDNVGLFNPAVPVASRQLLTAFDIQADPANPLAGGEIFEVSFDGAASFFFSAPFVPIPASELVFQSGTITVNGGGSTAVPEPGSLGLLCATVAGLLARRRRRTVGVQPSGA